MGHPSYGFRVSRAGHVQWREFNIMLRSNMISSYFFGCEMKLHRESGDKRLECKVWCGWWGFLVTTSLLKLSSSANQHWLLDHVRQVDASFRLEDKLMGMCWHLISDNTWRVNKHLLKYICLKVEKMKRKLGKLLVRRGRVAVSALVASGIEETFVNLMYEDTMQSSLSYMVRMENLNRQNVGRPCTN